MKDELIEMYNLKIISDDKMIELIKKKIVSGDINKLDIQSILDSIGVDINEDEFLAKSYLDSTDWIVSKISENQILGLDIADLLDKYSLELEKRKQCRAIL